MSVQKIMIIRHAEKPTDDGSIGGVALNGSADPEELTVRGWQRAGALVRFFAPLSGKFSQPALTTPDLLFASGVAKHSPSLRPQHTLTPLAAFLDKDLNLDHKKGEEDQLAADVLKSDGVVLIAWEHQLIPGMVQSLSGNAKLCPSKWPGDRFDVVWVLDRFGKDAWQFTQIPQVLLAGDKPDAIPF